jgi:hypothetical protein
LILFIWKITPKCQEEEFFFKESIFYVLTGSWITDKIKKMIKKKFNLQKCEVIFQIDSHWEIGHGWSSEEDVLNF